MSKVLVSLPDDLLERIDREARTLGTTRSRFIEEAARRQLGWPAPEDLDAAVAEARQALSSVAAFESAELVRKNREVRDGVDRHRL